MRNALPTKCHCSTNAASSLHHNIPYFNQHPLWVQILTHYYFVQRRSLSQQKSQQSVSESTVSSKFFRKFTFNLQQMQCSKCSLQKKCIIYDFVRGVFYLFCIYATSIFEFWMRLFIADCWFSKLGVKLHSLFLWRQQSLVRCCQLLKISKSTALHSKSLKSMFLLLKCSFCAVICS